MGQITVMSYNVCHYNMDQGETGFPDDIREEKTSNLKEMLMAYSPDIVGIQEDSVYIDRDGSVKSQDALWSPIWRYRPSSSGSNIRAKYACVGASSKAKRFSTGRGYREVILKVDRKMVLVLSVHPTAKVGHSEERYTEYQELFQEIFSLTTWDECIVTGDFNTTEKIDKEHLKSLCNKYTFKMAIGGDYLPWVTTYMGHQGQAKQSFDNILVSPGISFQRVKVLREWFDRLYSDHAPVLAVLEL